jgi:HEAT repeat protein
LFVLAEVEDARVPDAALGSLDDDAYIVRSAALKVFGQTYDQRTLPRLMEIASTTAYTDEAFAEALDALDAITNGGDTSTAALLDIYKNGNKWISPLAVERLVKLKDVRIIPELERIVWGDSERSAAIALDGLGKLGTRRCKDIVKLRLDDERPLVSSFARHWCFAVWKLDDPETS